jgi:hypothetical protein
LAKPGRDAKRHNNHNHGEDFEGDDHTCGWLVSGYDGRNLWSLLKRGRRR